MSLCKSWRARVCHQKYTCTSNWAFGCTCRGSCWSNLVVTSAVTVISTTSSTFGQGLLDTNGTGFADCDNFGLGATTARAVIDAIDLGIARSRKPCATNWGFTRVGTGASILITVVVTVGDSAFSGLALFKYDELPSTASHYRRCWACKWKEVRALTLCHHGRCKSCLDRRCKKGAARSRRLVRLFR